MSSGADLRAASIAVTVCPNGIGHAVRVLRVLRALDLAHGPFGRIDVALSSAQLAALQAGPRGWLAERGVRVHHGITDPGVSLPQQPDAFSDGRLEAWVDRWESSDLVTADLVVSDNLTGVLRARPDAVLMGSFLWSDVLEPLAADGRVAAFVDEERRLLAATVPPMLATADVVHPGVVERTRVVPLPWFDDRPAGGHRTSGDGGATAAAPDRGAVAILGGTTGVAGAALRTVQEAVDRAGREVVTDPEVLTGPDRARVRTVVCRPGLGTVTACVVGSLPMLLVSEPGNPELVHTTEALVGLDLARRLEDPGDVVQELLRMEEAKVRDMMVAALAARPTGGHRAAADWLAQRLGAGPGPERSGQHRPRAT